MLVIDDIVSLGYKNSVNLGQIKQYFQMESAEEKEFKRKKLEKELSVQKELEAKGREFDKQRREKKFNSDAISSSSFAFKEDVIEKESNDTNENKTLNIGKKKERNKKKKMKKIMQKKKKRKKKKLSKKRKKEKEDLN